MRRIKEAGFTLVELLVAIFGLAALCLGGFAIYWVAKVIVHFVVKFW